MPLFPKMPPPEILVCLFAHECLRRLGYPAEHIYVGRVNARDAAGRTGVSAVVFLRLPGQPEFVWIQCLSQLDESTFKRAWNQAVEDWNSAPPMVHERWGFSRWMTQTGTATYLPLALLEKGIPVPGPEKAR